MTTPVSFRSKFIAYAAVLACAMVLSVGAYARGGHGGGGGGFRGGGGGFHGGGGFRGGRRRRLPRRWFSWRWLPWWRHAYGWLSRRRHAFRRSALRRRPFVCRKTSFCPARRPFFYRPFFHEPFVCTAGLPWWTVVQPTRGRAAECRAPLWPHRTRRCNRRRCGSRRRRARGAQSQRHPQRQRGATLD